MGDIRLHACPRRGECAGTAPVSPTQGPGSTTTLEPCLQCAAAIRLGPITTVLAHDLVNSGEAERLTAIEVNEALGYLWPRLQELAAVMPDLYHLEMS